MKDKEVKMYPFRLQDALNGAEMIQRDGKRVKGEFRLNTDDSIASKTDDNIAYPYIFNDMRYAEGGYFRYDNISTPLDLFMVEPPAHPPLELKEKVWYQTLYSDGKEKWLGTFFSTANKYTDNHTYKITLHPDRTITAELIKETPLRYKMR